MRRIFTLLIFVLISQLAIAQELMVKVVDFDTREAISNALINYDGRTFLSGSDGTTSILINRSKPVLFYVSKSGYDPYEVVIDDVEGMNSFNIPLKETNVVNNNIVNLELDDLQDNDGGATSSLLTASRDPFLNAAAFNFFVSRFRIRGYDNEYSTRMINSLPMKNLHNSRIPFNYWGGLNDMFRLADNNLGLDHSEFMYGNLNGGSNVDISPLSQRGQFQVSYASSNRTYRNRLMASYTTGERPDGWAFSIAGSKRWAEAGYVQGTFYDAYSYFLGAEKRINNKNTLGLTIFGAPRINGRGSGSLQEMYDIADNVYYNPNWGYQNGEVRNSRYYNTHQPIINLKHVGQLSDKFKLTQSLGYLFGRSGNSRLDWYNAPDPRPDYYRYLPSYYEDPEVAQAVKDRLVNDENARQVDWDRLYLVNSLHEQTINNVNGIEGKSVTGLRSLYALEEDRDDTKRLMYNAIINYSLKPTMEINGGLSAQKENTHFHRVMLDLLGGDYWLDVDQFAERENPIDESIIQSNVDNPNNVIGVGDTYGYNYEAHVTDINLWANYQARLNKVDFHVGAQVTYNSMYRNGLFRDGNFQDESKGKSEVQTFIAPSVKAGINYKINGRNYIYTNATYNEVAPDFRNTFISNRTRNKSIDNPVTEKATSGEIAYVYRSPKLKAKALGYYTLLSDVTRLRAFYLDGSNSFVNYIMTGIGETHRGVELSTEYKITSTITLKAVAALGQNFYNRRPFLNIVPDLGPAIDLGERSDQELVYIENYRVPGPQKAYTAGISYNSPKYWFINLSFNYFDDIFLDFNPDRRTEYSVRNINKETQQNLWEATIGQEQLAPSYTMDIFGGWTYKVDDHYFILNVGVNNILNNQSFITGGFEQSRLGFGDNTATFEELNRFPNRYFYAWGANYFASIKYRIRNK